MDIKRKIISWLRSQLQESGAKGFVIGLSGGLDSSVTALLCNMASKNKTLGLILPCHSQSKDIKDAKRIIQKYKLKARFIELSQIYDTLLKILPKADKKAEGNLKARLRMLILYYFANKYNFLVVGTGNKSEIKTGYFTKYGDGGCDLLPIGDLLKTQVKELSRDLMIPKDIIDKAPSAGLWAGQTDEAELGISYSELDKILSNMENKTKQRLDFKIRRVKDLIYKSRHKRQGPKILYLSQH